MTMHSIIAALDALLDVERSKGAEQGLAFELAESLKAEAQAGGPGCLVNLPSLKQAILDFALASIALHNTMSKQARTATPTRFAVRLEARDVQVTADNLDQAEQFARSDALAFLHEWTWTIRSGRREVVGVPLTTPEMARTLPGLSVLSRHQPIDGRGVYTFDLAFEVIVDGADDLTSFARAFKLMEKPKEETVSVLDIRKAQEHLADDAFAGYDFGEGLTVVKHELWTTDTLDGQDDWVKLAYVRNKDDGPNADAHKISFHAKFAAGTIMLDEAYACWCESGTLIGAPRVTDTE